MNRPFNSFDRFILILDRVLVLLACVFFLWVQAVKTDFLALCLGISCLVGFFFTSRYMMKNFKETEKE
jgi:hypothetical protein